MQYLNSTTTNFFHKHSIIFVCQTRIWIPHKQYSSVQVSEFRKKIFERVILSYVLPPTTASRKRVSFGGAPQILQPKNRTHFGST